MSKFSSKHYSDISRWLKEARDYAWKIHETYAIATVADIVCVFADELEADNAKFDRGKFIRDCGIRE